MVNAKYGNEPGLKTYTHVNDQYPPFASQNIPSAVSEVPYTLDGLLMNEAGRQIGQKMPIQQGLPTICWEYAATDVLC